MIVDVICRNPKFWNKELKKVSRDLFIYLENAAAFLSQWTCSLELRLGENSFLLKGLNSTHQFILYKNIEGSYYYAFSKLNERIKFEKVENYCTFYSMVSKDIAISYGDFNSDFPLKFKWDDVTMRVIELNLIESEPSLKSSVEECGKYDFSFDKIVCFVRGDAFAGYDSDLLTESESDEDEDVSLVSCDANVDCNAANDATINFLKNRYAADNIASEIKIFPPFFGYWEGHEPELEIDDKYFNLRLGAYSIYYGELQWAELEGYGLSSSDLWAIRERIKERIEEYKLEELLSDGKKVPLRVNEEC